MGKGGYGLTYQEVYEMENLTIEAKGLDFRCYLQIGE